MRIAWIQSGSQRKLILMSKCHLTFYRMSFYTNRVGCQAGVQSKDARHTTSSGLANHLNSITSPQMGQTGRHKRGQWLLIFRPA
jgi:hypothetical protein